jgi:alkaline phosphatase
LQVKKESKPAREPTLQKKKKKALFRILALKQQPFWILIETQ